MVVVSVIIGNIAIFALMLTFAMAWNGLSVWRQRGRVSKVIHAYAPSRAEWSVFFWRRARRYLVSYGAVLAVVLFLPAIFGRRVSIVDQLKGFAAVLPGFLGYFILASQVPARFRLYPEGFTSFALIPLLPGQREKGSRTFSDFRSGLRLWRDFNDAIPRGEVMVLKGQTMGAELVIPHGQRDVLLGMAREGLKRARDEKRQVKRTEKRTNSK